MKLLNVISLEAARDILLAHPVLPPPRQEILPLREAAGRILAEDVASPAAIPAFSRSVVDGYAVIARDTHGATGSIPSLLDVTETLTVGTPAKKPVRPGTCAYVPTGGGLPEGADAVVMVEYTEPFDDRTVMIQSPVSVRENVILAGEDVAAGGRLLAAGTKLTASAVGVLAAAGIDRVPVLLPPKVWILSTGDELADPGQPLAPGQVYDVNTYMLAAAVRSSGMEVLGTTRLPDEPERLLQAVRDAMQQADIVLMSGGSSKGLRDMTAATLDALCAPGILFHGLAVRPGKPTIYAADEASRTMLFGLPGHPGAALMVFHQLAEWFWRQWSRQNPDPDPLLRIPLEHNLPSSPGRTDFQLVEIVAGDQGPTARPLYAKSGLITPLYQASGYIVIDRNSEGLRAGTPVDVYPFL